MRWTAAFAFLCLTFSPALAQTVPPQEAQVHVGETVIVRGKVDEVHTSGKNNTFLSFGGYYPHQAFTAFIPARNAAMFPNVHDLQGKSVEVSGAIKDYKGKPEIVLESPSQLKAE
jgi:DNA/RNA endonuclease YhcR with UshA esterase domain